MQQKNHNKYCSLKRVQEQAQSTYQVNKIDMSQAI